MIAHSVCSLLVLVVCAEEFEAQGDDTLLKYERIAECVAHESGSASETGEASFIQRNAHAQGATKVASSPAFDYTREPAEFTALSMKNTPNQAKKDERSMEEQAAMGARLSAIDNLGRSEVRRDMAISHSAVESGHAMQTQTRGHWVLHQKLWTFGIVALVVTICGILACFYLDPKDADKFTSASPDDDDEVEELRGNLSLPEDTLGFVICVIVRDSKKMWETNAKPLLRAARIASGVAVLALNLFLQVYLTVTICQYVVPGYVARLRDAYEQYEQVMYANQTELSVNHEVRGIDGHFHPGRFLDLTPEVREVMCQSPFSQMYFFIPVLFIWTLRCAKEIKKATDLSLLLIAKLPSVSSVEEQLEMRKEMDVTKYVLVGLTPAIKVTIFCAILLPRILVTSYLCWLGSRWLLAAPDLGELVLNTVALEIMVELKDLLYETLISNRNKRSVQNTELRPSTRTEHESYWLFLSSILWGFAGIGWVAFYLLYFQMVLLDYRWDVHNVCTRWLMTAFPRNIV